MSFGVDNVDVDANLRNTMSRCRAREKCSHHSIVSAGSFGEALSK